MVKVFRNNDVRKDLKSIGRRIASESQSLSVALTFLDRIEKKCQIYATQPGSGRSRPDLGDGVRSFPVDDYLVIYRPTSAGIELIMVIHGSRNYPPLVKQRIHEPNQ